MIRSQHRDVLEVDWPFFGELCRALALRIHGSYDPELVLGIAKAGVIPGVVVASILQPTAQLMFAINDTDIRKRGLILGNS